MFDENMFRYILNVKKLSLKDVAKELGISIVTLYRKINGESDFTRPEIQKVCDMVGDEHIIPIFFAKDVSCS